MRAIVLFSIFFLSGCFGQLYNRIALPEGRNIYMGMAATEVKQIMGKPDSVGQGTSGCPYASKFLSVSPMAGTVEWAWVKPEGTIVVWLDDGSVSAMGKVK